MLPREGKLADVLGLLEATTDNTAWTPFLRKVAIATGGESAVFMLGNPDLDLHLISHQWGQDPEGIRLYITHYNKLDVWAAKARHLPIPAG